MDDKEYLIEGNGAIAMNQQINDKDKSNRLDDQNISYGCWNSNIDDLIRQYGDYLRHQNYAEKTYQTKVRCFRKWLLRAEAEFGDIDTYRCALIDALINHDGARFYKLARGNANILITKFDMRQDDFAARTGLVRFIEGICGEKEWRISGSHILEWSMIKEILGSLSMCRTEMILRDVYGLTKGSGTMESLNLVSNQYGLTPKRTRQIVIDALKELRTPSNVEAISSGVVDTEDEEKFIRMYFKHHDIFVFSDASELDEHTKNDLLEIYTQGKIHKKERESQEYAVSKAKLADAVKAKDEAYAQLQKLYTCEALDDLEGVNNERQKLIRRILHLQQIISSQEEQIDQMNVVRGQKI